MYQRTKVSDSVAFFFMQFLYCPVTDQQSGQAQRFPLSSSCNFLARHSPSAPDRAVASVSLLPASAVLLPSVACSPSFAVLLVLLDPCVDLLITDFVLLGNLSIVVSLLHAFLYK